jgi:hypothetical protein
VIPFEDFAKFTGHLKGLLKDADQKPELQTAIVRKLVNRIEITPRGFEIEFFVGKERLSRELGDNTPGSVDFRQSEATKNFFSIGGSRRLTNGGDKPGGYKINDLPLLSWLRIATTLFAHLSTFQITAVFCGRNARRLETGSNAC